jgi:predicted ArsR family transcriptional regulator
MARDLDDADRGILHALQENAREATAVEMAEAVDVSASTVRNRIDRLESTGVVRGYTPTSTTSGRGSSYTSSSSVGRRQPSGPPWPPTCSRCRGSSASASC